MAERETEIKTHFMTVKADDERAAERVFYERVAEIDQKDKFDYPIKVVDVDPVEGEDETYKIKFTEGIRRKKPRLVIRKAERYFKGWRK